MSRSVAWRAVHIVVLAITILFAFPPRDAGAQTRADSAAVLLEAARRFEGMGRLDVADALYEHILERFGDTPSAGEVRRIRAVMPADRGARSGRVELQVWSTLYGAWLGVAVPVMLGADGSEAYGLGLLLGGPAGFLAARSYARSHQLTEGQARAITFGGTWGTWQGLGWALALDLGQSDNNEVEAYTASAVAGGLAGMLVGGLIARKPIPAGLATTVNFGALWGTWFGSALAVLADLEDNILESSLIGGNAGLLATAVLAPRWQMSRNRARLVSVAGVLGGLAGGGVALLVQPDDERVAILFPLAGSVAGLAIGAATTRDHDRGGSAPGGEESGALLDWRAGRGRMGMPAPYPMLLRSDRARDGVRPAIGVTLLRVRF